MSGIRRADDWRAFSRATPVASGGFLVRVDEAQGVVYTVTDDGQKAHVSAVEAGVSDGGALAERIDQRMEELATEFVEDLDLLHQRAVRGLARHYAQLETRIDAWRPIVEYAANVNCRRLQSDPSAPTCRSPVPGEGLLRDQWCIWCEAREVF